VRSGGASVLGADYRDAIAKSLDYAVMERTKRAAVVELCCDWSDVGSWNALWEIGQPDEAGNVVKGETELLDTQDCYVASSGPLVAVVGQRDLAVVCTEDAVLVADRTAAAAMKVLVERMRAHGRREVDTRVEAQRPWGAYRVTDRGERFQVKRITVAPGGRLSLQRHRHRAEHWVVVGGEATVTVDAAVTKVRPSEHVHIPQGAVHRLENFGEVPVDLIEVQTGSYLGEDDIERLEDVYERA
jgi:mannose-1-phosphate guanylyltransferase/mannose-6-phosphate isomerase